MKKTPGLGMPAHATLMYPFVRPDEIDDEILARISEVLARHACLTLEMREQRRWPDTLYASVEPQEAVMALQSDLEAAFPAYPAYGGAFPFYPHVTIVEGDAVERPENQQDPAWRCLPITRQVRHVDLMSSRDGKWSRTHRFDLKPRS